MGDPWLRRPGSSARCLLSPQDARDPWHSARHCVPHSLFVSVPGLFPPTPGISLLHAFEHVFPAASMHVQATLFSSTHVTPLGRLEPSLLVTKGGKYPETSWRYSVTQPRPRERALRSHPALLPLGSGQGSGQGSEGRQPPAGFCWPPPSPHTQGGAAIPGQCSGSEPGCGHPLCSPAIPLAFRPCSSGTPPTPTSPQLSSTTTLAGPPTIPVYLTCTWLSSFQGH